MEIAVSGCHGTPEFLPVSANPYYCLPTGSQSPYGDLLMVMLESLVECKGQRTIVECKGQRTLVECKGQRKLVKCKGQRTWQCPAN